MGPSCGLDFSDHASLAFLGTIGAVTESAEDYKLIESFAIFGDILHQKEEQLFLIVDNHGFHFFLSPCLYLSPHFLRLPQFSGADLSWSQTGTVGQLTYF